jgi:hypothetical protein
MLILRMNLATRCSRDWSLLFIPFLVLLPLAQLLELEDSGGSKENTTTTVVLRRIMRDITGQYHPELHGDKVQFHSVRIHKQGLSGSNDAVSSSFTTASRNGLEEDHGHAHSASAGASSSSGFVSSGDVGHFHAHVAKEGYDLPPAAEHPHPQPIDGQYETFVTPDLAPNCGCVETGRCAESQFAFTRAVIEAQATTIRCGRSFMLCCYDDPWPGVVVSLMAGYANSMLVKC